MNAVFTLLAAACLSLAAARSFPMSLFQGWAAEPQLADGKDYQRWCHGLECPVYKVLNRTDDWELRRYEPTHAVVTKVAGLLYGPSQTEGFMRLFKYIGGENEDSQKIEMTAPVITDVHPGAGPFCKSNYTVAFYLPEKFQSKHPQPNDDRVTFIDAPATDLYALSFGGYLADDITLSLRVKQLQAALAEDSIEYDASHYVTMSYDPPTRVTGRHNEVAVRAPRQGPLLAASAA